MKVKVVGQGCLSWLGGWARWRSVSLGRRIATASLREATRGSSALFRPIGTHGVAQSDWQPTEVKGLIGGISFPVLYDPEATVPEAYMVYGLIESGRAAPSTFILDKNGIITWKHIGRSISDRIGPYSILQQLQAIQS